MSSENNDNTSFISASSGNTDGTFLSCGSATSPRENFDLDSQLMEPDEVEHGLESENEEDGFSPYDMQLNGEALDALEESLRQQLEALEAKEKEFTKAHSKLEADTANCIADVMEKTEQVKMDTVALDNDTKNVILARDQALQDLRSVEQAFSDVHRKYERSKITLENLKTNEELLKQRDEEFQLLILSRDQKKEAFKQEMEETLEKMYNDFQAKVTVLDTDNGKLAALHRRAEMRVETLESELAHKLKENAQLNSLVDDLIGRSANPI